MARWRTHHRRALRKEHDDQARIDAIIETLKPAVIESLVFAFVRAMPHIVAEREGIVVPSAFVDYWNGLADKVLAENTRMNSWPDVVLDDILDAEFVGG
jgi:hypothetical protein